MRLTVKELRSIVNEAGPGDGWDEFQALCAELWSSLEGRFGNIKTNQSKTILQPNRMFVIVPKNQTKQAVTLISHVVWIMTGERPKYRKRHGENLRMLETSSISVRVQIYHIQTPEMMTVDVSVGHVFVKETTLRENVGESEYNVLCEELHTSFVEEFGEKHVTVNRGAPDPRYDGNSPWSAVVTFDDPRAKAVAYRDQVVTMVKNTLHVVTGEHPINVPQTNYKRFDCSCASVTVGIWDEKTLRVAVLPWDRSR